MKKFLIFSVLISSFFSFLNAQTFVENKIVKVDNSIPIYRKVEVQEPYRYCWKEKIRISNHNSRRNYENNYNDNDSDDMAPKVIGGIVGGILGSQFGKGTGKIATTIIGTVSGSLLASEATKNERHPQKYNRYGKNYYDDNVEEYQIVEKCKTKYKTKIVERIIGYKNIFYFRGKKYQKITKEPLNYIEVKVSVSF